MEEIKYTPTDRIELLKKIDADIQVKQMALRMRQNDRLALIAMLSDEDAKTYMTWYLENILL